MDMEFLTVNLGHVVQVANETLTGPFYWLPDATNFFTKHFYVLGAAVVLYLPVIFGLKVRWEDKMGKL